MTVKVQTNAQGKVYYTNNGKVLLSNQNEPVINSLSITPSTSTQTITAPSGVDGYSPISVSAVTSSIDANITAENIKDGVQILGVTGSYQGSGGGSSRFGLSLDNFIGNVTNGVLGAPNTINGITFTGVTEIASVGLQGVFNGRYIVSGTISAPSLTIIRSSGLDSAFANNRITSVDLSALTTVERYGMSVAFSNNLITDVDLSALTTVRDSGLESAFDGNRIASVDLSALTTVGDNGLRGAFSNNRITSVDLSALTTVGDNGLSSAFENNGIASVDLSALTTVRDSGLEGAFSNNRITSVDLSALTTVGINSMNYAFYSNRITSVDLSALTTIGGSGLEYAFSSNQIEHIYFRALTSNSFEDETCFGEYMLEGNDGATVHFPSNLESVIGEWDSVLNGFGGDNTTVLFDLPATE